MIQSSGVAISKNPYRSDLTSFFVNTQIGGNLVTDASTSEHTAEQLIIYDIPQQGGAVPEVNYLPSSMCGEERGEGELTQREREE